MSQRSAVDIKEIKIDKYQIFPKLSKKKLPFYRFTIKVGSQVSKMSPCTAMLYVFWTNERPVTWSRDHSGPMRGEYWRVICILDQ